MALATQQHQQASHPYDSRQIANWFIRRAHARDQSISIMHVLKLVYMAHGWCLAVLDRPLIQDRIEAWDYGPVIPAVYHAFRPLGVHDIQPWDMFEREIEDEVESLLQKVDNLYENLSASQLSRLTHIKGGPWHKVYRRTARFQPIPDSIIAAHYKDKLARAQNA